MLAVLRDWFRRTGRDLPWRGAQRSAWGVLVSEVMLQQTPVARVLPAWLEWTARWPDPAAQALASPADVVRQWGRLGYPRRALRLRETALACRARHGEEVPAELADLLALPGVGEYTARAVAAFAFGQRWPVVDTNVARVVRRAVDGVDDAGPVTARDRARLDALLPAAPDEAVASCVALMELGALVCLAARPKCAACPVAATCAWRRAGAPQHTGARGRAQPFAGTDRQVRGLLLARLRDTETSATAEELLGVWSDPQQAARALASLVSDGLASVHPTGGYRLPQ